MVGKNVILDPSWFMFPYDEFCKRIKPLQKVMRTYYVQRADNIHSYYLKFVDQEVIDKYLENYYTFIGAKDVTYADKNIIFTHDELLKEMIETTL
jgi:hypothetical protein